MNLTLAELAPRERYKILIGLIVPRPIALITTRGTNGVDNAAPFSFFNILSSDPPIVVVSFDARASGATKDTLRNIRDTGEFVVNLVDENLADAMHLCSTDLPPERSEIELAKLTIAPATRVKPGRIAESPVSLECTLKQAIDMGPERTIVLGEGFQLNVRDGLLDPATMRINDGAYHPIGRFYGNLYCRTNDRFTLPSGQAQK